MADLALRIAARYLHAGYLNVGDYVWAGKYKNKLAIVTAFGQDEKGNPTITISPIPKGRKQDKTFSLFKVWKVRPEQIAELKAKGKIAKTAAHGTVEAHSDVLWKGAEKALMAFQSATKELRSVRPGDPTWEAVVKEHAFLPTPLAITTEKPFVDWLDMAFGEGTANTLDELRPKGSSLVADNPDDAAEVGRLYQAFLGRLDEYERQIQTHLDRIAPAQFSYAGFRIYNPNRIEENRALAMLDGVKFLLVLFERRGVEPLLREGVENIVLNQEIGGDMWHGYYASDHHEIALSTKMIGHEGRVWKNWIQEVFAHEFGHHVHLTYIKGEARDFWNSTWQPVKDLQAKLQKISPSELEHFYAMLEKDGFQPGKTAKRLNGIDKIKFAYWLRNPMIGEPLITPAQFRLTKHGEAVFQSLRDPLTYVREVSSITNLSEEENVARLIKRRKEDVLGLGYSGGIGLSAKDVDEIRKADPSIEKALNEIYAELGVPSEYGKKNENEDFAEAFAIFITDPDKLSENALYRMKRTLWLSGFGGKPVMRLAQRVLERHLMAAGSRKPIPSQLRLVKTLLDEAGKPEPENSLTPEQKAAEEADRQRLIAEDLAMEAEFARQERERLAQPVVYDPANTKLEHAPMARRLALRVKLAARPKLPTLWYENEAGDRWEVSPTDPYVEPPEGFIYQHSRFPHVLRETVLRMVQQSEVDACDHPADMMKPDLGLIEGLEGRECLKCHGTQVKDAGAPWPAQWEAHGSREMFTSESTWSDELVLAMVKPSPQELALAIERHGEEPRLVELDNAIILAATSCERCLNGLLWRYGCNDGYPPYGPEWNKSNTKCAICETPGVWDWLLNEKPMTQRTRQTLQAGEHYTELCRKCGTVMGQCRCASPNKVTVYGLCDACNPQAMEANGPVDWQTVEITSRLAGRVADRYLETKLSPHQRGWEKRKEKDDFTEQNIPPEHLALWRKLKNQFKGTPHERATAFMEYVESHPNESDAVLQQNADKEIAKLQREQEKERREQAKVEKECDKNQTLYENAWYREQERQTKEKAKLKQLKEKADSVCEVCPTCHQYGPDEPREMVPFSASQRVAARYKKKHHIKTQEGKDAVVYEYSENQVARRNAEKAKRLEGLRKNIGNLRAKVKRDLRSSDPEKALTALAVALIDHTYERVGNDGSAKERGHYGVTGWQKSHVSFGRGKATVKYVGKSGVEQKKTVSDKAILTALRNAYEACGDDDGCLFEHATGKIGADKVNAYLEAFDVSAKDLRGFHANDTMIQELHTERGKGGKLSEDKKERKTKLKEEFKAALERTAEIVGHEPSTLRSQYLVPSLESEFMKDGTIIKSLTNKTAAEHVLDRFLGRE